MWTAGILFALVLVAGLGLWIALQRNAPAVLDTIDALAGPKSSVEMVREASTGPAAQQRLFVYRDGDAQGTQPVFVFFHGGAWAHGDPVDYGFIGRNIAPEGYVVVLGGYRMNGPGRYPAMLEDTAATIAWVRANIAEYGGDPDRIVLSGHSAGAYNAMQVALDTRWLEEAGVPVSSIRGVVGLSGPYDFYPFDTDRSRAAFESVGAGPESQPVNHARADAPPVLLVHGEEDVTVRIRNSRALEKALGEKGARAQTLYLAGKDHNAPLLALTNPWRRDPQVFDRVMQFLRVSVPVQAERP
ncbi:alpha/beta hydrolase [Qipengyuania sphaerica]|uniref:alpha/beta hydrolase n=1 Tax=Qipengyuania sphaerica TaxID=2867243 RepID=UPI001C87E501|nr:alpha/beta hydrolase [Qipengyuania sphaerica]MBX7541601.1 alpha/beta hydrolase [Qipengyuania sphaerica]